MACLSRSASGSRLPSGEVYAALATSSDGLSPDEVRRRLMRYGPNSLQVKTVSLARRFFRQFIHFLALLLWIAAGLAFPRNTYIQAKGWRL